MALAVDASPPFHRSHSTPALLSALPKPPPSHADIPSARRANSFKSLPSLPAFDVPSFDIADFESALEFGTKPEPRRRLVTQEKALEVRTETVAASSLAPSQDERLGRSRSMIDRPRSWLPSSKSSPNIRAAQDLRPKRLPKDNVGGNVPEDSSDRPASPAPPRLERSRTVESFADFAKRSWISSSRSPSPPSKADRANGTQKSRLGLRARSNSASRLGPDGDANQTADSPNSTGSSSSTSRAFNRASIYLTKIKQKPQSVFSKSTSSLSLSASASPRAPKSVESESTAPSAFGATATASTTAPSAPAAAAAAAAAAPASAAKLASFPVVAGDNASRSSVASSSTPRNSSHTASSVDTTAENASQSTTDTGVTMPHPTSRDPLWNTFRILDTDYAKFTTKNSTSARIGVVRLTLLPFLRSTSHHPSNFNRSILSPEDIERRAIILDQWWNGLLEILDLGHTRPFGSNFGQMANGAASNQFSTAMNMQPVAGVDRPTLLEAIAMVMARPEWRLCTSSFQPLAERSPEERVRARSGTQSTIDSDQGFLAESAEHNVRNMFVTNLVAQMALVVDKMSMRHAPLSLVNWCGKACAYAFFFAPNVADVLVRLWILNGDLLRRVSDEFGLPRKNKGESEDIVALFPPHLGKLGWSSVKELGDRLRLATKLPLTLAKIPWHGQWVSRWRGGDTDLFFIFSKYYHILAEEFMPEGLPLLEKARAPAFVLLHSQLLSILDSTIHRQASIDAMMGPPLSDSLHGADAALTGLPLPSNLLKSMDENRLVILLKDMLAESSSGVVVSGIKHTFAEAFVRVLKAATKRTSRYEHAACFTLCDFLEVALMTLDSYQNNVNNSIATSPTQDTHDTFALGLPKNPQPVDYIDWPFWFDVGKMIMGSNNTMSEIRIISFLYSMWDAITADASRKEALCLDWLLSEEIFEKFFNNWCPMVRAYYMRLLCWRVCRDLGSPNELDVKIFLTVSQRLRTVWSHYLWGKQTAETQGRMPPSTAPCYPTPGKRFLIIRTEVPPMQPNILPGFDSFSTSQTNSAPDYRGLYDSNVDNSVAKVDPDSAAYKKKWSLLGKVLSFTAQQANAGNGATGKRTWDEELEQARRETAASRTAAARSGQPNLLQSAGPPPPPKQRPSHTSTPSSDSGSSTGSAPVYDAATYIFRFSLAWQGNGPGSGSPTRDRILSRPRLPAPAQACVSTRVANMNGNGNLKGGVIFRSESPPRIAAGLPPVTRRVSGVMQTGLVSEARNARPLSMMSVPNTTDLDKSDFKRLSLNINVMSIRLDDEAVDDDGSDVRSPTPMSATFEGYESDRGISPDFECERVRPPPPTVRALRPVGIYAQGAVYAGRALAEWSLVVGECNSFVDRRRDEGVLGLSDVEVPSLSVEGLGIRQKA
ncbi:hypothetical protein B0H67DRAFT_549295 [Lasiosphaeris hirsuta]|uniref:Uncharacterized protein n=1 Tax=Lasiosphaeris hirsuta TaxID=260670 RepID=A0AA40EDP9_9PEZI|nr:hypothetical protein B0H67DRAFT_549295 [Lasiosphaeris hirsuta]